jgi:hypothetical protein
MLKTTDGNIVWTESEGKSVGSGETFGYGPLSVANDPDFGKYSGGMKNANDMVVWTNNADGGRGKSGFTFAFQLPPFFHESQAQVLVMASVRLKEVRWNAVARPIMSADGQNMFVGVSGSQVRAWAGDTAFDQVADWSAELALDEQEPSNGKAAFTVTAQRFKMHAAT